MAKEAGASADHWAREKARHGHEVPLITPHDVEPFIERRKNDAPEGTGFVPRLARVGQQYIRRLRITGPPLGSMLRNRLPCRWGIADGRSAVFRLVTTMRSC